MYSQELVEKHYPGAIMIKPMKYGALPKNKKGITIETVCNGGEYFAQVKEDGNLYMFVKGSEGQCYLFSRNQSVQTKLLTEKIDNVPHIKEALSMLPNGTVLLGEIYYPGGDSNMARRVMGCLPKTAISRQENELGWIHFHIFDILAYDKQMMLSLPALERARMAEKVFMDNNLFNFYFLHFATIYTEDLYQLGIDVLGRGGEGIVLKKKSAPYTPDKRPAWHSIKFKKEDSADLVCMGYNEPTMIYDGKEIEDWEYWINPDTMNRYPLGKNYNNYIAEEVCMYYMPVTKSYYHNWAGSMIIGAYNERGSLVEVGTVSSGLSDLVRAELVENSDKYLGKVVKIDMMEKFEGTIRQPIYRGLHDDKNPTDCLLKEIFQ